MARDRQRGVSLGLELQATFQSLFIATDRGGDGLPAWAPSADSFQCIRLWGHMMPEDISTFVANLFQYNGLPFDEGTDTMLSSLKQVDTLLLPGGLCISDGEHSIPPGCCCGLEEWRDWFEAIEECGPIWLGHSPTAYIKWRTNTARFWSCLPDEGKRFHIDAQKGDLLRCLSQAESDLRDFLRLLRSWAIELATAENVGVLVETVDASFRISRALGEGFG